MDINDGFGEILEKGQNTVGNAVKKTASDFASTAKSQITGSVTTSKPSSQHSAANPQMPKPSTEHGSGGESSAQKFADDQNREQFLKDLYGAKDSKKTDSAKDSVSSQISNLANQITGHTATDSNSGKSPEEIAKIQALRSQLHSDYYRSVVNRPKQEEERTAEKVEREVEEEKFAELQKKKEKPDPLATVKRGTGETMVGASG